MAKSKTILMLLTVICLAACEKAEIGNESQSGSAAKILFTTFTSTMSEYSTRTSLADAKCTKLDFAMFDSEGKPYQVILQENTDADFGTIALTDVPYGTYSVVLIGSTGSAHATIASPELASFGGKVPDTFCKCLTLDVNKSTATTQSIELNRITSEFMLTSTDAQPSGLDSLQVLVTGGSTCFNPTTGLAPNADINVREIKSGIAGNQGKALNVAFLTFLPSEKSNLSVVINAKDAAGDVQFSQSIASAPMQVNCISRYTGKFFAVPSSSSSVTVTVNNKWADTFNYEF